MEPAIFSQEPYLSFRKKMRGFVASRIKPQSLGWERKRFFATHLLKEFGKKKYLGLSLPRSVGGQGKDFWHEVILAEELARSGTLGCALSILVQTNMVAPILFQLGTRNQKNKILKPALLGNYYLALAATDPQSGSDLAAVKTEAVLENGSYILNGEKRYISNGSIAKYVLTLARVKSGKDIWSLGLFIVPADTKGVERKRLKTLGLKTGDTASIIFKNCKIPKENILGVRGKGFYYLLKGLQRERLICAVALNALASLVIDETIVFLNERNRFGEPLSKKQVIRHRIAELKAEVEASRQLAYAACAAFANNKPVDAEIVMLKIFNYETCQKVIKECAHLHGAEAFLETHWLAHIYQDSQAFTLAAGTSEVMKDLLAGMIGM
jgi:acyl-CoA dehydrogenase